MSAVLVLPWVPVVFDCDSTATARAKLRGSPRWDRERARVHDFRNAVAEFSLAVQLQDQRLVEFCGAELTRLYCAALKGDL